MRELILQSLEQAVKLHPEVIPLLKGYARWYGEVLAWKRANAPDDEQRRKDERRLAKKFAEFLDAQLSRVLKELKKQYQKNLQPSFWEDEDEWAWESMADDFVGILIHGVDGGIGQMGGAGNLVDRDHLNTALLAYARQYRNEWLSKINQASRAYVEQAITNWLLTGEPISELVRTLSNQDIGMFSKVRAERIAVTEVTRLFSQANRIAYQESGVVDEFMWMTANDDIVCEVCDANDGKTFPVQNMDSMIPAHPNCRCWGNPVVNMDKIEQQFEELNSGV